MAFYAPRAALDRRFQRPDLWFNLGLLTEAENWIRLQTSPKRIDSTREQAYRRAYFTNQALGRFP